MAAPGNRTTITSPGSGSGTHSGFSMLVRDLTQRQEVLDSLQGGRDLFEQLFETTPDAVVVVDDRGVIRQVNQQAEALFGYRRDEMVGSRIEKLMPERFRKHHQKLRRGYYKEPRTRKMGSGVELFGCSRDGVEMPLDIMLTPMEMGEVTWVFAVIRDITLQKQNQARISELTAALQLRVRQLIAKNRELEGFMYTMSHDLRAQLRHISGFVELLETRDLSALDQRGRHYLQVITDSVHKMGHLIDDLLEFARVSRIELKPARVDLDRMVRDLVREVNGGIGEREIEWKVGPLPSVVADPEMLRQVMRDLIGNAVKFTQPRAHGSIEIGVQEAPEELVFHVRDNGVGFDARYVNKLFGLFQRLHGMDEFAGTGVGLASVKRIVTRHGGRVWADGVLDQGATFWFALPRQSPLLPGSAPAHRLQLRNRFRF